MTRHNSEMEKGRLHLILRLKPAQCRYTFLRKWSKAHEEDNQTFQPEFFYRSKTLLKIVIKKNFRISFIEKKPYSKELRGKRNKSHCSSSWNLIWLFFGTGKVNMRNVGFATETGSHVSLSSTAARVALYPRAASKPLGGFGLWFQA